MVLLATDLDGTFIGDDDAMLELWHELDEQEFTIAFATGRHLRSVFDFYERVRTRRRAAACICMVGTEIWRLGEHGYEPDERWRDRIVVAWDRASVVEVTRLVLGDAEFQPEEWQSALKVSYFVEDFSDERAFDLDEALASNGVEAKVVFSGDRFLDLLPARSGKGAAVACLAREMGLTPEEVVVAGDTGNDLDMMRPELGFRSIAVGNAAPELASYHAPRLYHAANPFARGIREGLIHHGYLRR